MATATAGAAGFLTRVRGSLADETRTDAELVGAFAAARSEEAFDELVRRFAPMVWAVCRRRVGDRHLAEDAFQAVFLVLVRKAAAIRPPAAVGGWLHAVAVHTSLRARAMADRRRRRETHADTVPDLPARESAEPTDPDLVRVLDEEIAKLPDGLRAAVALCELDGVPRRDAAKRLGIAEGTLSSRLAAARKRLAARLRSRGVTLGAGLAVLAVGRASAAPPLVPNPTETITALAEGAIRAMFLNSSKRLTAAVLAAVALLGVALSGYRGDAGEPGRAPHLRRKAPIPVQKAGQTGRILVWLDDKPQLIKPDGTELDSPDAIPNAIAGVGRGRAHLSPDGKRVAFESAPNGAGAGTVLKILELDGDRKLTTHDAVSVNGYHWMADGRMYLRGYAKGGAGKLEDWILDPATDKRTPLAVPKDFFVRAVGPDGKTMVVDEWKMSAKVWHQRAHLWEVGKDKPTPLLELNAGFNNLRPAFSPDGKKLLCKVKHYGTMTALGNGQFQEGDFKFHGLLVIDLATGKKTVVKDHGEEPEWHLHGIAWSPDGKKVAYVEEKRLPNVPGRPILNPHRVTVCDPDGRNAKEVYTALGDWLLGFDWR